MSEKNTPVSGRQSVVSGKHVLVAEDIEVNRLVLEKIMTTLGATCDVAGDGREALERFVNSQPDEYDLILMDIQMPIMDGYEATKAIRASSHSSALSVPIIAMTASARADDIRNTLRAGMDAHISKPIVLDRMERIIQEVFDRKDKQQCDL